MTLLASCDIVSFLFIIHYAASLEVVSQQIIPRLSWESHKWHAGRHSLAYTLFSHYCCIKHENLIGYSLTTSIGYYLGRVTSCGSVCMWVCPSVRHSYWSDLLQPKTKMFHTGLSIAHYTVDYERSKVNLKDSVFVWGYTQVKQQFISQMSPHKNNKIQGNLKRILWSKVAYA